MAGIKRRRLPLVRKSCAPAFMASTATSSPIEPETKMNGVSGSWARNKASAAGPLNSGML